MNNYIGIIFNLNNSFEIFLYFVIYWYILYLFEFICVERCDFLFNFKIF